MGHIRSGRFLVMVTAGVLSASGVGYAMAQGGIGANIAATGSFMSVHVAGLRADSITVAPAAHQTDSQKSSEPAATIVLDNASLDSACILLRTHNIPLLGTISVVARLPQGSETTARQLSLSATDIEGSFDLHDVYIGPGIPLSDEASAPTGVGVKSGSIKSSKLSLVSSGIRASELNLSAANVDVTRGGTC